MLKSRQQICVGCRQWLSRQTPMYLFARCKTNQMYCFQFSRRENKQNKNSLFPHLPRTSNWEVSIGLHRNWCTKVEKNSFREYIIASAWRWKVFFRSCEINFHMYIFVFCVSQSLRLRIFFARWLSTSYNLAPRSSAHRCRPSLQHRHVPPATLCWG